MSFQEKDKHYDTGYGLTRKYFKKREELLYKKKEDSEAVQILKEKKKVEKIEKIKQEDISSKHAIENKEDVKETGLEILLPLSEPMTLWQSELWMQLQASATESRKISPSADLIIPL